MKAPKAPPYPTLAAEWIDEANYLRMNREAQIMIVGFAAVRSLYESAERIFGKDWRWLQSLDLPMRTWAQNGNLKDDPAHYFDGMKAFLAAYHEGRLANHLAGALNEVKAEFDLDNKTNLIVKLAKQADHVLVLATAAMREVNSRTDLTPGQLRAVWKAMTAEKPTAFELGQLQAFFPESSCIAIQAFVHASVWMFSEVIKHCSTDDGFPPLTMDTMLKTFYALCANFLGMDFGDLHILFNTLQQEEFAATLNQVGLSTELLAAILAAAGKKQRETLKDKLDLDATVKKLAEHHARAMAALQTTMIAACHPLLYKLVQGDRRFLDAWGLSGITGATPSSLSRLNKRSGNSSSSSPARNASGQSPRQRLAERQRSESSPVKRIMTVERGVRPMQSNPLPSPRRAPDSPRPENSTASRGQASKAAQSPLVTQKDE